MKPKEKYMDFVRRKRKEKPIVEYLKMVPGVDYPSLDIVSESKYFCRLYVKDDYSLFELVSHLFNAYRYADMTWDRLIYAKVEGGGYLVGICILPVKKDHQMTVEFCQGVYNR